jgi:hypothetical protein
MFFGLFSSTKDKRGVSKLSFRALRQAVTGRILATRILEGSAPASRSRQIIAYFHCYYIEIN